MVTSVNTNSGALQALSSYRSINANLDATSKKIQTGKRVADAFDDASTFAVAQGLSAQIQQNAAVQQSLSNGLGIGAVAGAALGKVSDLVGDIQAKITQLSDGSLSSSQVATYSQDLFQQLSQVANYVNGANYNGQNILTNSTSTSFLSSPSGSTIGIAGQAANASTATNTFVAAAAAFTSAVLASPGSPAAVGAIANALSSFTSSIGNAQSSVAADTRGLASQQDINQSIADATRIGLGAQVDADLAASSAALASQQVQRSLAGSSLSIANQQPGVILSLFR